MADIVEGTASSIGGLSPLHHVVLPHTGNFNSLPKATHHNILTFWRQLEGM